MNTDGNTVHFDFQFRFKTGRNDDESRRLVSKREHQASILQEVTMAGKQSKKKQKQKQRGNADLARAAAIKAVQRRLEEETLPTQAETLSTRPPDVIPFDEDDVKLPKESGDMDTKQVVSATSNGGSPTVIATNVVGSVGGDVVVTPPALGPMKTTSEIDGDADQVVNDPSTDLPGDDAPTDKQFPSPLQAQMDAAGQLKKDSVPSLVEHPSSSQGGLDQQELNGQEDLGSNPSKKEELSEEEPVPKGSNTDSVPEEISTNSPDPDGLKAGDHDVESSSFDRRLKEAIHLSVEEASIRQKEAASREKNHIRGQNYVISG